MDLMTFKTVDLNVQRSQELDFRLITTSKNNFSEIPISRPKLEGPLRFPFYAIVFISFSCNKLSVN